MQLQCCRESCVLCMKSVHTVPLFSFPLDPLWKQWWPVASSPLSVASEDVVAGAWSPGLTQSTAAVAARAKQQKWVKETRSDAEWRVHSLWCLLCIPSRWFGFIHTCLAVSRRLAGRLKRDTAETGVHFMINVSSTSSAQTWADISFLLPGNQIKLLTCIINIYTAGLSIFMWLYLGRTSICTNANNIDHFRK